MGNKIGFKIIPKRLDSDELQSQIIKYLLTKDEEDINPIIEHYCYVISGMYRKLTNKNYICDESIISEALILLIRYLDKYDDSKGATFKTYFKNRLEGFIKDYVNFNINYQNKLSKREIKAFTKLRNKVLTGNGDKDDIDRYYTLSEKLDSIVPIDNAEKYKESRIESEVIYNELICKIQNILNYEEIELFKDVAIEEYSYGKLSKKYNITSEGVRKRYKKIQNKLKEGLQNEYL